MTKPFEDKLADYSVTQLKSAYQAESILREEPMSGYRLSFGFADEVDAKVESKQIQQTYGRHTWSYTMNYFHYTLKPDWYDAVYLEGIGSVKYKNKTSLVLDAEEIPVESLREDLQFPGCRCYKVKLPVWTSKKTSRTRTYTDYTGAKRTRTYYDTTWSMEVEERFMVASVFGDNDSMNYAAVHLNAAGANLKKAMMLKMEKLMGV